MNDYDFNYNDLGWLTRADHLYDDSFDRDYRYNRLGNRDSLYTATDTIAYEYDPAEGSSRLLWFTGMGDAEMKYDVLGNMIEDSSRFLYNIWYDYRNLIDSARMSSALGEGYADWMLMGYDETGQRLEKGHFKYFWTDCETNPPGPPPQPDRGIILGGGEPGDTCIGSELVKTFYLYDGGVLLATFDREDNVIDLYINSPTGLVASYHENDPDQLYYYETDQIGSPRVIMHSPGGVPDPVVAQYINYHPFGQVSQSYGSFDSPLKFTGKEQDNERDFEFYYFGARYLDARIGMFTSVDKAGQFAGGYLYGGNNPILGTDPNGNLFGIDDLLLLGAAFALTTGGLYLEHALDTGDWGWDNNLKYATINGALTTASLVAGAGLTKAFFSKPLVPGRVPRDLTRGSSSRILWESSRDDIPPFWIAQGQTVEYKDFRRPTNTYKLKFREVGYGDGVGAVNVKSDKTYHSTGSSGEPVGANYYADHCSVTWEITESRYVDKWTEVYLHDIDGSSRQIYHTPVRTEIENCKFTLTKLLFVYADSPRDLAQQKFNLYHILTAYYGKFGEHQPLRHGVYKGPRGDGRVPDCNACYDVDYTWTF